jgi:hypothetical protein
MVGTLGTHVDEDVEPIRTVLGNAFPHRWVPTLRPGDTAVHNGTRHRWRIVQAEPAVLAVFSCGAHHQRFDT